MCPREADIKLLLCLKVHSVRCNIAYLTVVGCLSQPRHRHCRNPLLKPIADIPIYTASLDYNWRVLNKRYRNKPLPWQLPINLALIPIASRSFNRSWPSLSSSSGTVIATSPATSDSTNTRSRFPNALPQDGPPFWRLGAPLFSPLLVQQHFPVIPLLSMFLWSSADCVASRVRGAHQSFPPWADRHKKDRQTTLPPAMEFFFLTRSSFLSYPRTNPSCRVSPLSLVRHC